MEDTIAEKLLTIAENEQNVFNAGYEKGLASGGVPINNQDKTITENGVYQADEGYTGLGTVTVEVASTGGGDIDALIDGSITEITSNATSVRSNAFYYCNNLETVILPNATSLSTTNPFYMCQKLKHVEIPLVKKLINSLFAGTGTLKTIKMQSATEIGNSALSGCPIETIDAKFIEIIGNYGFKSANINLFESNALTSIGTSAFASCKNLTKFIIRNENTICTLSGTNAFTGTPIASGTGYIYVPRSLVDSYKSATNWSTFATQIRALEDYTVDGTVTGELDESKI